MELKVTIEADQIVDALMKRLGSILHTEETGDSCRLLLIEEVAETLRKSPSQLRWMIHQGTAPKSALIGGRRVFRLKDVNEYIDRAFGEAE